jgi:hypothetical protein
MLQTAGLNRILTQCLKVATYKEMEDKLQLTLMT